jgi:hypothetical protein
MLKKRNEKRSIPMFCVVLSVDYLKYFFSMEVSKCKKP